MMGELVMIPELTNHLWQSTLFAGAAALLTVPFRKNRAQVRYWLWFSASLKFVIPFSLLISMGSDIHWTREMPSTTVTFAMEQITQPFSGSAPFVPSAPGFNWTPVGLLAAWLCGFAAIVQIRFRSWRSVRASVRASHPIDIPATVEIRVSPGLLEPGVVGIFRPILLLPAGITDRLTPRQLEAVLAHELCHVRRRDNLFASIHMVVEAIFWFHPLVWWIGARLVEERERACDEAVLSLGSEPRDYAEGILNVCKLYVESPLVCVSGVTGSNLRKRIEAIMANRHVLSLTLAKKATLAAAGILALAIPLLVGMMNTPLHAQSPATAPLQFEVASIRPNNSEAKINDLSFAPGGRLTGINQSLRLLIMRAYGVRSFQISGGPSWLDSAKFDVEAKREGNPTPEQMTQMFQSLLADRFQLRVHRETKDLPIYALLVAKNGPKLERSHPDGCTDPTPGIPLPAPGEGPVRICGSFNLQPGRITGTRATMSQFAAALARYPFNQSVVDKTALDGTYDINLQWTPDETAADRSGPSIFTTIQEQLGLRLESQKGPVETLVIDHAEKPSAN